MEILNNNACSDPQPDEEASKFIYRCLTLASFAQGKTAPNPMVGAIIVHNGLIIGQGYHRHYGEAHAEVNAINSVKDKSLLSESTLYVNLEPCSHFGKTPPCVDLMFESKISRVVIGMADPNPKVNGKGISKMQNAGIEVIVGIEQEACRCLNKRFITNIEKHRPFIILKWAQTADGFIDKKRETADLPPLKISDLISKTLNHKGRTQEAAILVGTRTALLDNPKLTVTKWAGKNPVRLIIDRNLVVPKDYNIFDGSAKTVIFNDLKQEIDGNIFYEKLDFSKNIIFLILNYLSENSLESLIVEGGRQLLQSFIDKKLWDEVHIETSNQTIGRGVDAPRLPNIRHTKRH
jgi:diaminohydroxyphosphoribosylaminopyrimidine deaminase/5-amino-6-(5-phosphoribosylamino)uracil reductase